MQLLQLVGWFSQKVVSQLPPDAEVMSVEEQTGQAPFPIETQIQRNSPGCKFKQEGGEGAHIQCWGCQDIDQEMLL